jgi:hypothetical protein
MFIIQGVNRYTRKSVAESDWSAPASVVSGADGSAFDVSILL